MKRRLCLAILKGGTGRESRSSIYTAEAPLTVFLRGESVEASVKRKKVEDNLFLKITHISVLINSSCCKTDRSTSTSVAVCLKFCT